LFAAEIFTGGLQDVFPSTNDFPVETINLKLTPDGSHYWAAGQGGEVKKVCRVCARGC